MVYENKEKWPSIIKALVNKIILFEKAFKKPLKEIGLQLRKL